VGCPFFAGLNGDQLEGDQVGVAGSGAGDVKHGGGSQRRRGVVRPHHAVSHTAQRQGVRAARRGGQRGQRLHRGQRCPACIGLALQGDGPPGLQRVVIHHQPAGQGAHGTLRHGVGLKFVRPDQAGWQGDGVKGGHGYASMFVLIILLDICLLSA